MRQQKTPNESRKNQQNLNKNNAKKQNQLNLVTEGKRNKCLSNPSEIKKATNKTQRNRNKNIFVYQIYLSMS